SVGRAPPPTLVKNTPRLSLLPLNSGFARRAALLSLPLTLTHARRYRMRMEVAQGQFQTFAVEPPLLQQGKTSTRLVRTDHLNSGVQVVATGGETNLHAHSSQDEIWFVLSGEATF